MNIFFLESCPLSLCLCLSERLTMSITPVREAFKLRILPAFFSGVALQKSYKLYKKLYKTGKSWWRRGSKHSFNLPILSFPTTMINFVIQHIFHHVPSLWLDFIHIHHLGKITNNFSILQISSTDSKKKYSSALYGIICNWNPMHLLAPAGFANTWYLSFRILRHGNYSLKRKKWPCNKL